MVVWRLGALTIAAGATAALSASCSSQHHTPSLDYACQHVSIQVSSADGVVSPVAINRDVAQRLSTVPPTRVTAHMQPGCRASAVLVNNPIPLGVDIQTQVVPPDAPREWLIDHHGQFRLTVAVGMCDLGPKIEPGCIGGLATLATAIITVRH